MKIRWEQLRHHRGGIAIVLAALIALALAFSGCGKSDETPLGPKVDNPFATYSVGTDTTFEVVTWNLHNFATSAGAETVDLVAKAILALDADVVAVQEIAEPTRFTQLAGALPGWSGQLQPSDSYGQQLAFLWNASTVTLGPDGVFEIFTHDAQPFPRPPLVMDLVWNGHPLLLIDNHLKCCGDGTLDANDAGDEETRRRTACDMLASWITSEAGDRAVVVMGDMNDLLTDVVANNVFTAFLDAPDQFAFADLAIATGAASGWSYGPGRSHLDHFVVTNELFAALGEPASMCQTMRLDQALGGGVYQDVMSDHAPVALRLDLDP